MYHYSLWQMIVATVAITFSVVYSDDKIIGTEHVVLGVSDVGSLCVPYVGGILGLPANDPLGFNFVCLRNGRANNNSGSYSGIDYNKDDMNTYISSTPGDGWLVTAIVSPVETHTCGLYPVLYGPVPFNTGPTESSGQNGDTNASTTVFCEIGDLLVKHSFRPSVSSDLMEIEVSLINNLPGTVSFLYARAVGWDIYPTRKSFVTHVGINATVLNSSSSLYDAGLVNVSSDNQVFGLSDAIDVGPGNFRSGFAFQFPDVASGQNKTFRMYYGVSAGLEAANNSLLLVKAEIAALAKPSTSTAGLPYTYILAFSDIGGTQVYLPNPPPPTPSPPSSSPPSCALCFSGVNTVEERDSGIIPITELKIGDFVKTVTGQYSQVYGFGHLDRDREEMFLQIHFSTAISEQSKHNLPSFLEISSKHFVFVERNGASIPIKASDVVVGDTLSGKTVASIQVVRRQGVYAPLTMSGDIVVSGIRSSNYVDILEYSSSWYTYHTIAHALWGPHRLFCNCLMEVCKQETYYNGYNWLATIFLSVASSLNRLGWFVNMVFHAALIVTVNIVYVLEVQPMVGFICMISLTYITRKLGVRHTK